jgi:hypothetical protein
MKINISYHFLIKFHDCVDKSQEGMKHQMRGDFRHNSSPIRDLGPYTGTLPLVTCSHGSRELLVQWKDGSCAMFFAFLLLLLLSLFRRGSKKKQWLVKKK